MGRKRNWAGVVQGRLTVLKEQGRDKSGNVLWLCRCACGAETLRSNNSLNLGVKSCSTACGVAESNTARARHGMWNSKEYKCWSSMKQRCLNPKVKWFYNYGGRGITICQPWIDSFEAFLADVGKAPDVPRASLDRIDPNGNYEPNNVRWATPREQSNNQRRTLVAEIGGEILPLADIARNYGVPYHQVFQRYTRGLRGNDLVTSHKVGRKQKR